MAKKGLTQTQKDYNKAYKNVINRIEKMKSQGYVFSEKQIPKKLTRPQQKSIENLKKLTKKELASQKQTKFTYKDEAGQQKTVTGSEGISLQRSEAVKKSWETRRHNDLIEFYNGSYGHILFERIKDLVGEFSEHQDAGVRDRANRIGDLLEQLEAEDEMSLIFALESVNESEVIELIDTAFTAYPEVDYGDAERAVTQLEALLRGRALTMGELIERQTQADREEFAEYDDTEPLPFW